MQLTTNKYIQNTLVQPANFNSEIVEESNNNSQGALDSKTIQNLEVDATIAMNTATDSIREPLPLQQTVVGTVSVFSDSQLCTVTLPTPVPIENKTTTALVHISEERNKPEEVIEEPPVVINQNQKVLLNVGNRMVPVDGAVLAQLVADKIAEQLMPSINE